MKKYLFLSVALLLNVLVFGQNNEKEKTQSKPSYLLKGRVKDATTKKNIYDATVILKGSDGTEEVVKTAKNGKYIFDTKKPLNTPYLKAKTDYTIQVKKEGYKTATSEESTNDDEEDVITLDFLLEKLPE